MKGVFTERLVSGWVSPFRSEVRDAGDPGGSDGRGRAAPPRRGGAGGRAAFGAPWRRCGALPASRLRQWEAEVVAARRAPPADWPTRTAVGGAASGAAAAAVGLSVRSGHDGAQLRVAARPLLRLLGPRGHRRPLVRAQGAEPRGDHHDAGHHRRVLLPLLAHRHPGPGQPPVRAAAEERDHLVCALPLGVRSPWEPAPGDTPPPPKSSPSCCCSSLYPLVPGSPQRCWDRGWTRCPSAPWALQPGPVMAGPLSMAGSTRAWDEGLVIPAPGSVTLPGKDPLSWPSAAVTDTKHHPERDLCVVPADPVPAVLALLPPVHSALAPPSETPARSPGCPASYHIPGHFRYQLPLCLRGPEPIASSVVWSVLCGEGGPC